MWRQLDTLLKRRLNQADLARGHLQQRDQLLAIGAQLVGVEIAQVRATERWVDPLTVD